MAIAHSTHNDSNQPPKPCDEGKTMQNVHENQTPSHQTGAEITNLEYLQCERRRFLPIKSPVDWTKEKDERKYIDTWGESENYWQDTQDLLEADLAEVHEVLDAGLAYLAQKSGTRLAAPPATLTMREKVILFTELLPASAEKKYRLRFSISLAHLLWLESERERLTEHAANHQYLYPFYTLADAYLGVAVELDESLECEHADFRGVRWHQETTGTHCNDA